MPQRALGCRPPAASAPAVRPEGKIIETDALNANAGGLGLSDATIAVTRGLLPTLSDEELEAVLAHDRPSRASRSTLGRGTTIDGQRCAAHERGLVR
ncbi:MAG TPA: M48 family metalloprotease [Hyphomicrobiaceae bacterium]|nr:M48 family metalloprotease [Hyphomicrobiaceae bacterium]